MLRWIMFPLMRFGLGVGGKPGSGSSSDPLAIVDANGAFVVDGNGSQVVSG